MNTRESLYNLGNDYFQETSAYFVTDDTAAELSAGVSGYKAYSDGLYHFTKKPAYELSGGTDALNKRIFNVPQSAWGEGPSALSGVTDGKAVMSPGYATGVVVEV